MFDDTPTPSFRAQTMGQQQQAQTQSQTQSIAWDRLPEATLLEYYANIRQALGDRSLATVDMEKELVIQMQLATALQSRTLNDEGTPPNQKASVLNATTKVLQQLSELQNAVYTSERLKNIERLLIKSVQTLAPAQQKSFMAGYKELIGRGKSL